jgi:hypothetical protein
VGIRNYLIEGVSGTGKTSVCKELQRRGYHAINGDNELAYEGDPETGKPMDDPLPHVHHIWLKSTSTHSTGGSTSDAGWTQMTGAEDQANGNSLCERIKRKRQGRLTSPAT